MSSGILSRPKSRGVQVLEFGIGFPPRIWGIKRGETIYSINALPLGGFVKLAGEEDPKVPRSLASKGYGTRILVLAAGSIMNILLPIVLFSIAFMIPHDTSIYPVTIDSVAQNSPAAYRRDKKPVIRSSVLTENKSIMPLNFNVLYSLM